MEAAGGGAPSTTFLYVKRDGTVMLHFASRAHNAPAWPVPAALCGAPVDRVVPSIDPDGREAVCSACEAARAGIISREAEARIAHLLHEALDPTCTCGHRRSGHLFDICRETGCTCRRFIDKDDEEAA